MAHKKNDFHSGRFQKAFYDALGEDKKEKLGMLSCGYEERYNPRLVVNNENARDLFKKVFCDFFQNKNNACVLDVCSGSGLHLPLLSTACNTVIGLDASIGLLKRASELKQELDLNNVFLLKSFAESIPCRDTVFDSIIMIDAIHHVENQAKVLDELKRVAKPGAPFLLIEPNVSNPLVYLAHRIPVEERGALRSNTTGKLRRLLSPYIEGMDIRPFNYVASKKNSFAERCAYSIIEILFSKLFYFWPIRLMAHGYFKK